MYYLVYNAEMQILMFNDNKYSQESHLVSLLYRSPIFLNKGGGVTNQPDPSSVAAARAGVFAILVNKFCKIMKIFQRLDLLISRWVLCQF